MSLYGNADMQRFARAPLVKVWVLKEACGGTKGLPVKRDMNDVWQI